MSTIKMMATVASLSLLFAGTASANHWHHRGGYYGYGYGYGYRPVVVAPPPVVVAPYPAPVYAAPAPVYSPAYAPGPVYAPAPIPAPVYAPPAYSYGVVGPRGGFGFGYSSPGFGVYVGR